MGDSEAARQWDGNVKKGPEGVQVRTFGGETYEKGHKKGRTFYRKRTRKKGGNEVKRYRIVQRILRGVKIKLE
jgi:hypothetical protein